MRLNSRPWAEVTIDGKHIGPTPLLNVALRAGSHTVQLENPQFGLKKTVKIQIEAGETKTQVIDLQQLRLPCGWTAFDQVLRDARG